MNDLISRQAALSAADSIIERDMSGNNDVVKAMTAWKEYIKGMPPAQPSLYGYDLRNLIVFADAVNKKGISDSEIEDFVRNARAAWEYAWEEFLRVQKEALKKPWEGEQDEQN